MTSLFVCVAARLYYHFRPEQWYWILIILGRKFLIAITALMFNKNPAFQMAIALLVLFVAYALQVRFSPYMSMSERATVLMEHKRKALLGDKVHQALAATIAVTRRQGKRSGVSTSMDKAKDRRTVAVSFFWNYNTVESVLLFSAVLVNLAGVMFESGRFDSGLYNQQKQFLTWAVIIVITLSIGYFVVVLVSEVYTMLTANSKKPASADKKKGDAKAAAMRRKIARTTGVMDDSDVIVESGMTNPLFHGKGLGAGGAGGSGGGGALDASSMAALLALEHVPSLVQWTAVRHACSEVMSTNQQLVSDLAAAKKASQAARQLEPSPSFRRAGMQSAAKKVSRRTYGPTAVEEDAAPSSSQAAPPGTAQ
jgi:hypothetical protein